MDATRVEIDLPVVIIGPYGALSLDNHHSLADVVSPNFRSGEVVSVHIIVESTGFHRGFCDFIDPESTYKSKCSQVLDSNGVCWMESEHEKKRNRQLELIAEEVSQ